MSRRPLWYAHRACYIYTQLTGAFGPEPPHAHLSRRDVRGADIVLVFVRRQDDEDHQQNDLNDQARDQYAVRELLDLVRECRVPGVPYPSLDDESTRSTQEYCEPVCA